MQLATLFAGFDSPAPDYLTLDDFAGRLYLPIGMRRRKPRPTKDLIGEYGGRWVYSARIVHAPTVRCAGFSVEFRCRCGCTHRHGWNPRWVDQPTERESHCPQDSADYRTKYFLVVSMAELRRWRPNFAGPRVTGAGRVERCKSRRARRLPQSQLDKPNHRATGQAQSFFLI